MNSTQSSDEPFQLTSKVEIASVIRGLLVDRILVSVFWGNAQNMFVSRILSVDADAGTFVIDAPKDGFTNVGVRRAGPLRFEATHRQIRIRFSCDAATQVDFDKRPALQLALPKAATRIQRRSDFRVKTPVLASPTLSLKPSREPRARTVRVTDISCGGLSFNIHAHEATFDSGAVLRGCSLQLPDETEAEVSIEIRHVEPFVDGVGRNMYRLGCQYESLPLPMGTIIRRYVNQLELERRQQH